MRVTSLLRPRTTGHAGISGVARLDRRIKDLTRRLRPGDIAVINQTDIDGESAEALVARGVVAVVNAAESISGRYPNLGPQIIVDAGIVLIDLPRNGGLGVLRDGDKLRIDDGVLTIKNEEVARGEVLDRARVGSLLADARAGLSTQLESFTANTMEYLHTERDLLLDGAGLPDISTRLEGRHVLVAVRSYDYERDLRGLRHYIAEYKPVMIGVDGGADALIAAGHTPDLIVGEVALISEAALRCGAEIVVRAHRDGHVTGVERLEEVGVVSTTCATNATSEDLALLLADHKAAALVVSVGSHTSLIEFLDRGRASMASAFLTRLRVGPKLIDAKAAGRLYRSRIRLGQLLLLLLAGVLALVVALAMTPTGHEWLIDADAHWHDLFSWGQGLLS